MTAEDQPARPDTIAIRAGRDEANTSLAPTLWATSAFITPSLDEARRMSTVPRSRMLYQ